MYTGGFRGLFQYLAGAMLVGVIPALGGCTVKIFNTKALVLGEVALTSLTGGQFVDDDSDVAITWSTSEPGSGSVQLEYSLDSGSSWTSIASNESNDGSYTWRTPVVVSNEPNARIRLTYTDQTGKISTSTSSSDFVIDALSPVVSLLTLTGAGVSLRASGQSLIVWNATDLNMGSTPILLEYSTTGVGGPWINIASDEINDGSYLWTIPSTTSAQYRVRVTATDSAGHSTAVTSSADITVASVTLAIAPTTFNPTASTSNTTIAGGRWHSRMVKLSDGKVLIAGGQRASASANDFLATTTIYDPATGNLTGAPPMFSRRSSGHTLTTLADGRVMAAGGYSTNALSTASVDVFSPSNGRWQPGVDMGTDRTWHTATLLNDGRVLVTGGIRIPSNTVLQSTALYDPYARVWYSGPNLGTARYGHGAIKLPDGRVLVMGGSDGATRLTSAEIFDPMLNTFSATGAMTGLGRMDFGEPILLTATEAGSSFPEGAVFVGGGFDGTNALSTTTLFDIDTSTWSAGIAMTTARRYPSFVKLNDGKIFVAGGEIATTPDQTENAEWYDVATGAWTARATLTSASIWGNHKKSKMPAILLNNGSVFVFGGTTSNTETSEPWSMLFDPTGNAWAQGPAFGPSRNNANAHKLTMGSHAGKVLTCGGVLFNDATQPLDLCEFYDPETSQIINAPSMNSRRERMESVDLGDGRIVFLGGASYSTFNIQMNNVEIYDQIANTWSVGSNMPGYRRNGSALKLTGNKILYAGGFGGVNNFTNAYNDNAWVYDADLDNWAIGAVMPASLARSAAVRAPSGRNFIHGGYDGANALATLYEYLEGTTPGVDDSWATLAGSTSVHSWHTMNYYELGGNPYLFVAGGFNDGGVANAISTVRVYDITGNTWSAGASMPAQRGLHRILEQNGNFLSFGGYFNGQFFNVYEYTPGTIPGTNDGWTTLATSTNTVGGNLRNTGVILDDGRIFVNGGAAGNVPQTEFARVSEVYSRVSTQVFTASGGDETHSFSHTTGPGTFYPSLRQYIPSFPLASGGTTATIRVTDGTSATADAIVTY